MHEANRVLLLPADQLPSEERVDIHMANELLARGTRQSRRPPNNGLFQRTC
jgi:hypothetical protein